jgi:SM-20-related protein
MPRADFFARLGLFATKELFDKSLCASICIELSTVPGHFVPVGRTGEVDTTIRSARACKPSPEIRSRVSAKLEELRPELGRHFGLTLVGFEKVQFLCYHPGDFYVPHRDCDSDLDAPAFIRARKVSVVLFLNAPGEPLETGAYCGGSLTFYGLMPDPRLESYGFALDGEEGLMIAFRSDLLHEVTPVTHGQRYTAVTWYY